MLQFADTPYESYPPKPNPLMIWLLQQQNRFLILPAKRHRIKSISLHDAERVGPLRNDPSARILFIANHSTHSDPQVMGEVQRRLKITSCFMAAYDVFQRGKLNAWLMQRFGAFSVDRDGSDSKAMKQAVSILKTGRYALTIFPEGNVYFMNDRACPFLDGTSFIALKAQKNLGSDAKVYVVPVSNKFTHRTDQRRAVVGKVSSLAQTIGTEYNPDIDLRSELMRIGTRALRNQLEKLGYSSTPAEDLDFVDLLETLAKPIIENLEARLDVKTRDGDSLIDRIRRIRSHIHQIRIDSDRDAQHPEATHWAEEAILALRILSYAGDYIQEKPTLDRYAETVEKLVEDHSSVSQTPWAPRHVYSCVNEPIDLTSYLEAFQKNSRNTMAQLTRDCEASLQSGLDEMNELNTHPGGELF